MNQTLSSSSLGFSVPAGACDTHVHIYDPKYPLAATATAAAPAASAADYERMRNRLGLTRCVVVQPSAYGTDNRCTLEGIAALGRENTRGVVVIDDGATDPQIEELQRGGAVGARFLMREGGAIPWDQLDTIVSRVANHGWHVQLQMDGLAFPDRLAQVRRWTTPIVIDHFGTFSEAVGVDHPAFRSLLGFLERGDVWVKLSAPYIVSSEGPPDYRDVAPLARALLRTAPERILWASDWPHPSLKAAPDETRLLGLLSDWVDDEKSLNHVLVENPARLYGFSRGSD